MKTKNLMGLTVAAVVLGGAAVFLSSGSKPQAPRLSGRAIVPNLKLADVARIEIGDKLKLAASDKGWKIESLQGYPADANKIAENLLRLTEQKVGQVVRGRALGKETDVVLKDASGKTLASVKLGDRHRGRYVGFEGETVLVKDSLDAFDGETRSWCETRIASVPSSRVKAIELEQNGEKLALSKDTNGVWQATGLKEKEKLDTSKLYSLESALSYLDFTSVVDPSEATGLDTGAVYRVTYEEGSNTVTRVATVGGTVKGGSDRLCRLDGSPWVFAISPSAAQSLTPKREDLIKKD